jgi:hypothetical protein
MAILEETDAKPHEPEKKHHEGRGIHVKFWSGASTVEDPVKYFRGEPAVARHLEFLDWLRQEQQRQRAAG